MFRITAVYQVPGIKHVFLVVQSSDGRHALPSQSCIQKTQFEEILQKKNLGKNLDHAEWITKIIDEDDFLSTLKSQEKLSTDLSNPSLDNCQEMELLALNLRHPKSFADLFARITPKVLDRVSNDDIIHVSL